MHCISGVNLELVMSYTESGDPLLWLSSLIGFLTSFQGPLLPILQTERQNLSQSFSHLLCCSFLYDWVFLGQNNDRKKKKKKEEVPVLSLFGHHGPLFSGQEDGFSLRVLDPAGTTTLPIDGWGSPSGRTERGKYKVYPLLVTACRASSSLSSGQKDRGYHRISPPTLALHPILQTPPIKLRHKREKKKKKKKT